MKKTISHSKNKIKITETFSTLVKFTDIKRKTRKWQSLEKLIDEETYGKIVTSKNESSYLVRRLLRVNPNGTFSESWFVEELHG